MAVLYLSRLLPLHFRQLAVVCEGIVCFGEQPHAAEFVFFVDQTDAVDSNLGDRALAALADAYCDTTFTYRINISEDVDDLPNAAVNGYVGSRATFAGGTRFQCFLFNTTGEPLVARVAMKPISTLMKPLATVDVATGERAQATAERSDVTAVPAMGVIAEAMLAFVLAQALLEKFGGDSLREVRHNYDGYLSHIQNARLDRSR